MEEISRRSIMALGAVAGATLATRARAAFRQSRPAARRCSQCSAQQPLRSWPQELRPWRPISVLREPPGNGCRGHATLLGFLQQFIEAHPGRGLGPPGNAGGLCDLRSHFGGQHATRSAGGIRELHWHLAAEWAIMTNGRCRVTVVDPNGRAYVQDVGPGDIWYAPAGYPHSLQGLGPDGCEFVIAFDQGNQSEYNTLLLTDWIAHTPPEILALNFGVPADTFKSIPLNDLWIFQGKEPGPLAVDQAAVATGGMPPQPFTFRLGTAEPDQARPLRRPASRRQQRSSRCPRRLPLRSRRLRRGRFARCIGIPTPTSGSTGWRAKAA